MQVYVRAMKYMLYNVLRAGHTSFHNPLRYKVYLGYLEFSLDDVFLNFV